MSALKNKFQGNGKATENWCLRFEIKNPEIAAEFLRRAKTYKHITQEEKALESINWTLEPVLQLFYAYGISILNLVKFNSLVQNTVKEFSESQNKSETEIYQTFYENEQWFRNMVHFVMKEFWLKAENLEDLLHLHNALDALKERNGWDWFETKDFKPLSHFARSLDEQLKKFSKSGLFIYEDPTGGMRTEFPSSTQKGITIANNKQEFVSVSDEPDTP